MKEYQAKVVESIGSSKEEKIRGDILQDRINKNPPVNTEIIITEKGEVLCQDSLSGRYFKSSAEALRKIMNDANEQLNNERWLTLNELYDEMGLEHTELGNNMGWQTDYGMVDMFFTAKVTPDKQPCLVVEYRIGPKKL